jgi:hypothetical protein
MNADSPYYPPRAGRWSPLLRLGDAVRRTFAGQALSKVRNLFVTENVTLLGMVLGLCVPGLAFYLKGWHTVGRIAMAACAALALMFLVLLGYPIGNAAFACLLSIHVTGVVAYYRPVTGDDWRFRLVVSLLLCAVVSGLVYWPVRNWLLPLRVKDLVVVFDGLASPTAIHRGEWIAFPIQARGDYVSGSGFHGSMIVRSGISCAPVLGLPGDHVEFSAKTFSVNGVAQPALAHMPVSGEVIVPKNCWFLWPEFAIQSHGMPEDMIRATMMERALVSEEYFLGKPFHWWFWRLQSLP